MMGDRLVTQESLFYRFRLDDHIPADHMLRAIDRFVDPEEFAGYEAIARAKGFLMVSASPLTRSSHHAGEDFARLRAARDAQEAARQEVGRKA